MKRIELTQDRCAYVDDDDFNYLNNFNWYYNQGYAQRNSSKDGRRVTILMHKEVLHLVDTQSEIDHIDGNGLNNQKTNLRVCSHMENSRNRKPQRTHSISGYKGVSLNKHGNWRSRITVDKRTIYLGSYVSKEDAAHAYDVAAIQYFGKFARLNFPK